METFNTEERSNEIKREPLQVIENVNFSDSENKYPPPFATREETFGLLSGSEGWTLCSYGEPVYSYAFVQCGAALIRNRDTGLITLIHQSTWSDSADIALALQHRDDIDVITIEGPFSYMNFKNVKYAHEKDPKEPLITLEKIDRIKSRKYSQGLGENKVFVMDNCALVGLPESKVDQMVREVRKNNIVGRSNLEAEIDLPLTKSEVNRWYLLYRPKENIIWIYESKSKKLFKYAGFDLHG